MAWGAYMDRATSFSEDSTYKGEWDNVIESTMERRFNSRLTSGLRSLRLIWTSKRGSAEKLEKIDIPNEEKQEIQKILDGTSKYKECYIYTNEKEYFVYFYRNGSIKEQLEFFKNVAIKSPKDIIESYKKGYRRIVFVGRLEDAPTYYRYGYFDEIWNMSKTLYEKPTNIVDVNKNYEEYIASYTNDNSKNFISNLYSKFQIKLMIPTTIFTKVNLYYILPLALLLCFIIYLILRKKMKPETSKVIELITILYGTSFGFIISYVIMGAYVDRYLVPILVPVYIADILLILLLIKGGKKLGKIICNRWKQHTK